MPIVVSLDYTREKMIKLKKYDLWNKTWIWIILVLANVVSIVMMLAFSDGKILYGQCAFLSFINVAFSVTMILLPFLVCKKDPLYNASVMLMFDEEGFRVASKKGVEEKTEWIDYSNVKKVIYNDGDVYLFLSDDRQYIVDASALPINVEGALKSLLSRVMSGKNFRW